jgi:nucleotide-binding universal stress UspA family protein
LVIGARGHGQFAGMLISSVSLHCVCRAPCPVVVIRPGDSSPSSASGHPGDRP